VLLALAADHAARRGGGDRCRCRAAVPHRRRRLRGAGPGGISTVPLAPGTAAAQGWRERTPLAREHTAVELGYW
jgi:hypothetical protein